MMYKYILCDLDNTILDFKQGEETAIKHVFESEGITFNEDLYARYHDINIGLWRELEAGKVDKRHVLTHRFEAFFKTLNIDVDGAEKEQIFRTHINNSHDLVKGARDFLDYLMAEGYIICSATNGVFYTQMKRMKDAGILDYFSHHFISEEIGFEKPHHQFFKHCIEKLGVTDVSEVLMIGDTYSSDIIGANQFGIDSCYYGSKTVDATYCIAHLDEIKHIL
ncbi:YjjG family noncanonical pyrimidine nucleotidase [Macrococcus armenti]|uniref:YjjG family noncanonical pyrimidine nucleotidase n=1 Tax=Macrococcus armenti TaxID=2875764 RepID=A0ABY3ZSW0_9STAP|nr:YjjG family noncanonical pyrimidine nucleotidase [Macrococcus armenti]UOB19975.1 YjjG family noncanonical pyrimidine nucleotidase [Macrococcus armenti]